MSRNSGDSLWEGGDIVTLQQLKYFRVLARTLHYTQAAELLHITQPSLSYAISSLEKDWALYCFSEKPGELH